MPKRKNLNPNRAHVDTSKRSKTAENSWRVTLPRLLPHSDFFVGLPPSIIKVIFSYLENLTFLTMLRINGHFAAITLSFVIENYLPYLKEIQPARYQPQFRELVMTKFKGLIQSILFRHKSISKAIILKTLAGKVETIPNTLVEAAEILYPLMAANNYYTTLKTASVEFNEYNTLLYAAENNQCEVVKKIIAPNKHLNLEEALRYASAAGYRKAADLLLNKLGPKLTNEIKLQAIIAAALSEQIGMLKYLFHRLQADFTQNCNILWQLANAGKDKALATLLDFQDFKIATPHIISSLNVAITEEKMACFMLLINYAKDKITQEDKKLLLDWCLSINTKGQARCLNILLEQFGNEMDANCLHSLLMAAVYRRSYKSLKVLLGVVGDKITLTSLNKAHEDALRFDYFDNSKKLTQIIASHILTQEIAEAQPVAKKPKRLG